MIVRGATEADIAAVAAIKVEAWRFAYRGIVPQTALDALNPDRVRAEWLGVDSSGFAAHTLVADDRGALVGYAMRGPVRDAAEDHSGQLYALYLRPQFIGTGLGKVLFEEARRKLREERHASFVLWVFEANLAARRFYERRGGRLIAGAVTNAEIDGEVLPEVSYAFRTIPAI